MTRTLIFPVGRWWCSRAFSDRISIMVVQGVSIPEAEVARFCRQHQIASLSLFGSIVRDDFRPNSDIDVLVTFEPGARVGLLKLTAMEMELSEMLGRRVDLNTPGFLSPYFRDQVLKEARALYVAA